MMNVPQKKWLELGGLVASVVVFAVSVYTKNMLACGCSAAIALMIINRWRGRVVEPEQTSVRSFPSPRKYEDVPRRRANTSVNSTPPKDMNSYVEQLLAQGRQGLLLRPEVVASLTPKQLEAATKALAEDMGLVPKGDVRMAHPDLEGDIERAMKHAKNVYVESYWLDRFPVTNNDFQAFVDSGAYEDESLWDPGVFENVHEFVDQTGHTGPRFWEHGRYPAGKGEHPVVGVSYFEAAAYSRWSGKCLPTDPQWVKAAVWPVPVADGPPQQRKYPWGSTIDEDRANLYTSGKHGTVSVTDYASGVGVGGTRQLIGNVWEWTTDEYGAWHSESRKVETTQPLKALRGGAFDTYYESHAIAQFQSGELPMARRHNIGFRCVIPMSEFAPEAVERLLAQVKTRNNAADSVGVAS
ncbi:MAG: formylglycine-generating enzyme family protein [Planctomycetales bacterium]|nr:formylglycine-generating enzyme family protein [Planctomycetales bacterium]MCA9265969.1 formylglycine-generating enzyme family protein [Planctomycetales bacterium]